MLFVQRVPAPPLDPFIASFWYCQSEPRPMALERVLPSGAAQLIVNLKEDQTRRYHAGGLVTTAPGAVLAGAGSRYGIIDTAEQECVAGVSFRPGGAAAFFRIPAHEMRDEDVPLELLWGPGLARELREQLLEAAAPAAKLHILERTMAAVRTTAVLHPAVAFALDTFQRRPGAATIAAVSDQVGLSPKRFIEHFKATVGMVPKRYCRVLRFQRALTFAEGGRRVDWTRIAADCGYFDQAHFIHDFRSFAGITPTGYDAGRTQFRNHVTFLQADAGWEVR